MEIHFIYHTTTPFAGYILPDYTGHVDRTANPTLVAYLEAIVAANSGTVLEYIPIADDLPDPETVKWDSVGEELVALESEDATPAMTEAATQSDVGEEISGSPINGLTWAELDTFIDERLDFPDQAAIDTWIDNTVTDIASAKTALKRIAGAALDLRDFSKQHARVTLAMLKRMNLSD